MKKVFVAAVTVLTLASCGTVQPDLYSWYDSEDATYQYTKRASDEKLAAAMAQYKKVISAQKGARGVVPPGVNAEYGYLLIKAGQYRNEELYRNSPGGTDNGLMCYVFISDP